LDLELWFLVKANFSGVSLYVSLENSFWRKKEKKKKKRIPRITARVLEILKSVYPLTTIIRSALNTGIFFP